MHFALVFDDHKLFAFFGFLAGLLFVFQTDGFADLDVFEANGTALFGEDRGTVRVPLDDDLSLADAVAGFGKDV